MRAHDGRGRGRRPRPSGASSLVRGERGVACLLFLGVAALTVSSLVGAFLPHVIAWRDASACVPGSDAAAPCAPEMRHPDLDVFSVAVKPTCVTRVAVAALNQYVGPRRIFFVTRDETRCDVLRAFASNVECAAEDALVPGLTKRAVADELRRLSSSSSSSSDADDDDDDDATHMGRTNAGWYLQQLLKLGAAAHVPRLSETFLVWDGDMIALWPQRVFGGRAGNTDRRRVARHVGGYAIDSYAPAYEILTGGAPMRKAPDGSSYVTHEMAMERRFVAEMLEAFEKNYEDYLRASGSDENRDRGGVGGGRGEGGAAGAERRGEEGGGVAKTTASRPRRAGRSGGGGGKGGGKSGKGGGGGGVPRMLAAEEMAADGTLDASPSDDRSPSETETSSLPRWAAAILGSVPRDAVRLGFSEYASYASWVAANHPETVELAPARLWSRHPFGPTLGSAGIRVARGLRSDGLCCPTANVVRAMKFLGYRYAGFEIGHVDACGLDDPKHSDAYGV